MKVRDTKGKSWSWNLNGYIPSNLELRPRSDLHIKARELLKELYINDPLLEEVPLPGENLFCDFYLPIRKLAIEVHGAQHYKYTPHFHGNIKEFMASKERDNRKKDWFNINGIRLIVLDYNEKVDEWKNKIINRN